MFNKYNLTENCHYAYVALPTKYGSWELMDTQDQDISTAHRYRAIMELIDETRTPPAFNYSSNVTCFGLAFNASDVCQRKGVCMGQDQCEPFQKPTAASPLVVAPAEGVSLVDKFYISTKPWVSRFSLVYAFGLSLPSGEYKHLTTNYSATPSIMTILPFIGNPYRVVVFAKDPFGNVYTAVSEQLVRVREISGQNLTSVVAGFNQDERLIALLDRSAGATEILSAKVLDSVNISSGDASSLQNLEKISSSFATEPQILGSIKTKLNSFLASSAANSALTTDGIQSVVNIVSTIYASDATVKDNTLINSLAQLLVNSGSGQTLDANSDSLPAVTFDSPSFKIAVSRYEQAKTSKIFNIE